MVLADSAKAQIARPDFESISLPKAPFGVSVVFAWSSLCGAKDTCRIILRCSVTSS